MLRHNPAGLASMVNRLPSARPATPPSMLHRERFGGRSVNRVLVFTPWVDLPSSMRPLYFVYLDRYHLGDPTFIKNLAHEAGQRPSGEPSSIMVHGSGEKVERTLEAQGYFPERVEGVLEVQTAEQRRLVERAVREVNRDLVGTFTDEVVSTVGVQGVDRGLLRLDESGGLHARKTGWIEALVKQRVLPVVSALARTPDETEVREVASAEALTALAAAFEASFDPKAVFLVTTGRPGIAGAEGIQPEVALDAVTEEHVPEPDAVRQVHDAGVPVLLTSIHGFYQEEGPDGSWVAG